MATSQIVWITGMVTCVSGALIGQAELLSEPYRHYVTILFIIGTAVSGYMVQRPLPQNPPK
jgi:hypothetical protein